MKSIKIVSDGTSTGTVVYGANGQRITGITAIEIDQIDLESRIVIAKITFAFVELEMAANMESEA